MIASAPSRAPSPKGCDTASHVEREDAPAAHVLRCAAGASNLKLTARTPTGYSATITPASSDREGVTEWSWEVLDPAGAPIPMPRGAVSRGVLRCARWRVQMLAEGLLRRTPGAPRHIRLRAA